MTAGPQLRSAVDDTQAATLEALSSKMHAAVTLRIERLLPVWCEGWCEDFPVEPMESLGVLYDHLESEWGGRRYKVTALDGTDLVVFTSKVAIAGEPKWRGQTISRARWEGRSDVDRTAALVPHAQSPASSMETLLPLFTLLVTQQRESSQSQLDGMRDMMRTSNATTTELLKELMARVNAAGGGEKERSIVEQLNEVLNATQALERVRRTIGGGATSTRRPSREQTDPMKAALGQALSQFMASSLGAAPAPASAAQGVVRAPTAGAVRPVRLVRTQPAAATETTEIPESIPEAGQ